MGGEMHIIWLNSPVSMESVFYTPLCGIIKCVVMVVFFFLRTYLFYSFLQEFLLEKKKKDHRQK